MESENLYSLIEKYKLSEKEHRIILEKLKEDIFSTKTPVSHPSVMFVIGQPGCGKTTFIQNADLTDYININSDNYRHFSKYSDEILRRYPTYYAKLTNFDAHLWGDELFSYGINNGYSVLREKAPVNYSLLETIKELSGRYDLNICVVTTGNITSLLATRERYEKEILKNSRAKLSSIEAHNQCYALLPDFISQCLQLGVKVTYVVPVNNEFRIVSVEDNSLNILKQIRQLSNEEACDNFQERINNIKISMRNRNAPQQQFEELSKIERIYLEVVNGKKTASIKSEELENKK